MHLLQKRIMYLNSDDALTDSNDTRGDLNIPVPQQLPDPGATDLVFKMYIQDAIIVNDNVNINEDDAQFSITVVANGPKGESEQVFNRTYTFPTSQMNEVDFMEMWNAVFGSNQLISVYSTVLAKYNNDVNNPVVQRFKNFESFRLEWVAEAYENDRFDNGYRPAIERGVNEQGLFPAFMPLGDRMMCLLRDVRMRDPFAGEPGADATLGSQVAWLATHLTVQVAAVNPEGGRLLGMLPDQTGAASLATLRPFWAAQYPGPIETIGTFTGTRDGSGAGDAYGPYAMPAGDSFASPGAQLQKVYNVFTQQWESYPSYESARGAAAMPNEMLMDDFTQLHINTDLGVNNSEVGKEGLSQSRITALVPVGVPHGGTIYYQDVHGINAAYERNQSTISRLHIWLTDKHGKAYSPRTPWTFSFALEIWQDDFKRMLDVLLASQSLHESTVKLHKLGLVGASFQALE